MLVKNFASMLAGSLMLVLSAMTVAGAEGEDRKMANEPMTIARLDQILKNLEPSIKGPTGRWQLTRDGVQLMILTDESGNRVRIVAPLFSSPDTTLYTLMRMMEANFFTAMDVRYALFKGAIWVLYIHPFDSLHERDFLAGLQQVVTLVKTTGTTYSSSELEFRSPGEKK